MSTDTCLDRLDYIYTAADLGLIFDALPETVVTWIWSGKIQGRKVGNQWVIPVEEIERFREDKHCLGQGKVYSQIP